jgi:hypothetical protein
MVMPPGPRPESFGEWSKSNPLKVLVAAAGVVLAFTAGGGGNPLLLQYTREPAGPIEALVRVDADDSVCWRVKLAPGARGIHGCGSRSFDLHSSNDDMWGGAGYFAEVINEYEDEEDIEPVTITLHVDGEEVDRGEATLGSATVTSDG